jgi:hypothetical protein
MLSNIEPLAREMTVTICRRAGMAEADIGEWVDLHWTCAAAMLEAGVMDEAVNGYQVRIGAAAWPPIAKRSPAHTPPHRWRSRLWCMRAGGTVGARVGHFAFGEWLSSGRHT